MVEWLTSVQHLVEGVKIITKKVICCYEHEVKQEGMIVIDKDVGNQ